MNIETVGTEADSVIDALPASSIQEGISGQLPVGDEVPKGDEFQAILQLMIEPSGLVNPVSVSSSSSGPDFISTINTTAFEDSGEPEGLPTINGAISADAVIPTAYSQPGLNSSSQHVPPEQPVQNPAPAETLTVKPVPEGEADLHSVQAVLPDIQQTMATGSLQKSAQLSIAPLQKRMLSSQEASTPESTVEPPANQESPTTTQPATTNVSGTLLKSSEYSTVRQPSSTIQPDGLTVTTPAKNCLMFSGDRHARAVAEFPGLGSVQVVMTRNNSEVTVNLQASKQSLPTLESCSSVLHQLVSDSMQQMQIPGNAVNNPLNREEPGGSSATESGLKIALSLTTPDHSGSDRGGQHSLAGELAGELAERSDVSDKHADILASAPQTLQEYRSSFALSRCSGMALIDLLI
ncbi:hypothetical protein [Endozoicomonas sp. SESOKO1]|uniref:hypothetical protein n=1 Tax=Endozoicomonas sp. SESOKO1 TaxID=2828742 RepID=UPI0021475378|nr:hypothetical protein [Endozoicomonas sp. SESOKO1]